MFDAITNKNISCKSRAVIQDKNFHAELDNINCLVGWLEGADEREGNYKITIHAKDYEIWEQDNIKVSKDHCHVNTKEINVSLNPLSG